MYRAVLISLLLHLAFLISPDIYSQASGKHSLGNARGVRVELRMPAASPPRALTNVRAVGADKPISGTTRQASTASSALPPSSVLPRYSPSTVATPASISATGQNDLSGDALAIQSISSEGERAYRLNLAREARKYKAFPWVAREWAVLVAVSKPMSSGLPDVSLLHSSGYEEIDRQALLMMAQAVKEAEIPSGLQGHYFRIVVPVEYRQAD